MTLRIPLVATLCAAGSLLAAGVATAGWPTWGHDATHSMRADQALQTPMAVLWKFAGAIPERGKGGNRGGVVVDGETLYFVSKNILYALDADSGELKWQMPEANSDGELSHPQITSAPGVGNGQVFVGDQSGTLTAHNAVDGNVDWEVTFKNPVRTPPLVIGQVLYIGCDDDNLRAYDISQKTQPKLKWRLPIGDDVTSPLSYYGGMLYVVSQDMRVWCINGDTGTVRWVRRTVQPVVNTAPVVSGTQLFVAAGNAMATYRLGNGDGRSYTLNDLQVDISGPPVITDSSWYFGDKNGWFYSFDKSTKLNWKIQLDGVALGAPVIQPPLPDGRTLIFVGTNKGFVSAINTKSGQIEWRYRLEPPKGMPQVVSYYPIQSPLAIDRNKLFVLSDDGALTCLSPGASDAEAPVVTLPRPSRGGEVNGSPPIQFSVYLFDEGSGVDPRTINMEIDGQPIPADEARYDVRTSVKRKGFVYDPVKRTLTYTFQNDTDNDDRNAAGVSADRRLAAGRHNAKIEASDYTGNHAEFTWSFIADPSLPKPKVEAARRRSQQQSGAAAGAPGSDTSAGMSAPGQPGAIGQPGQPGLPGGVYGRTGARGRPGRFIRAPGYGNQPGMYPGGQPGAYPGGAYPGGAYPGGQPGVYPGQPQPYGPGVPR